MSTTDHEHVVIAPEGPPRVKRVPYPKRGYCAAEVGELGVGYRQCKWWIGDLTGSDLCWRHDRQEQEMLNAARTQTTPNG